MLKLEWIDNEVIDNEERSEANSNYQRNREHNSINLVCVVDKTISVLTYKIGYFD